MRTIVTIAIAMVALAGIDTASAHSSTYINLTGDQLLDCNPDGIPAEAGGGDAGVWPADSQGGVCFPADHILTDASGAASATILDGVSPQASGFLCQDLNADNSCGDAAVGEVPILFCNTASLQATGVDANWNSGIETLIWVDGPVFGNAALSVCFDNSIATSGSVSHS